MLEEHRLAAAAPADDDHDLARGHVQVDAPEHRLTTEGLAQSLDPDHGEDRAQEVVEDEDEHAGEHDRLGGGPRHALGAVAAVEALVGAHPGHEHAEGESDFQKPTMTSVMSAKACIWPK